MRYANILLFLAASALGILLSIAAMFKLPFAILTVPDDGFAGAIHIIKAGSDIRIDTFGAISALNEVATWGGPINFATAVTCAILTILPALATILLAEKILFDKRADRGWKTIAFLVGLGAVVVAIEPVPAILRWYILGISSLMTTYIITYQWPRRKNPLQMPELKKSESRRTERANVDKGPLQMPGLQRRETPPHDRPVGQR
jgi:hypothetical protein